MNRTSDVFPEAENSVSDAVYESTPPQSWSDGAVLAGRTAAREYWEDEGGTTLEAWKGFIVGFAVVVASWLRIIAVRLVMY